MLPSSLLSPLRQTKIYLYAKPLDMRKSFDGLHGIVQSEFLRDIRCGDLFLFLNRRLDRVKLIHWDRDGLAIWMKKLESENTQSFGFTEVRRVAYNRRIGPAEAGRMVGNSRTSSPRRRVMSGQGSPIVPPRALRQTESFRSIDSGRGYPPLYDTRPYIEREAVIVTLCNENRPSLWEQVSQYVDQHGSIGNAEVRQLMGTENVLSVSKVIREWVDRGLLVVANPQREPGSVATRRREAAHKDLFSNL